MAMGTQTKFLIGLMLLVNALVLINIRRASPDFLRATGGVFRGQTQRRITPDAGRGDLSQQSAAASTATATSSVDVARPPNSQQQQQQQLQVSSLNTDTAAAAPAAAAAAAMGSPVAVGAEGMQGGDSRERIGGEENRPGGSGGEPADREGASSAGGRGGLRAGSAQPAVAGGIWTAKEAPPPPPPGGEGVPRSGGGGGDPGVLEVEVGGGGEALAVSPPSAGGDWARGREGGEVDILVVQAARREKQTEECKGMAKSLRIVPNKSWGKATKPQRQQWDLLGCNGLIETEARGGKGGGLELPDCTARPSAKSDPLIAVCAGSTTRGVPFPDEHSLALFRFLLPSLARTADCGFRYLAVVGYDVGDGFFDGAAGKAKTLAWFETEVARPAALRGLSIELELVRVENAIKKPGPVFTAVTKAAYDRGANYIYRVNDDSEMHTPWAGSFVKALEAMGPPYGVVGPESLNNNILVHDFTHRLHMDIFDQQYYPPSLTDWYVDDWISRVYGNSRTIRAKNCRVEHHTGAHGQRYNADTSKASSVDGLVLVGARKISAWASGNGAETAAREILSEKLDGKSATKARAREIP